ncbi:MAG TPA: hypothetical protein VN281_14605 [Verrucomicrobiae bacterium]|nr:hypothetical protein [Verrucomicrobiae bacterium]
MSSGTAMACAVAGATTMLNGHCAAQRFAAADYATNSIYAGGWSEGQNGGHGFGAWSFFGTDPAPGDQQEMTSSSPLGSSWTLFDLSSSSGIATAGRAIRASGGLQVGQTFETIIDNPSTTQFYRGWTISLLNNTNNNPGGVSTGELLSAYHFEYFNYGQWTVADFSGNTGTTLYNTNTAVAGMRLAVTLTSPTTYLLTMTPLGGGSPYTQAGSLKTNAPINWIEFNLYNKASSGTNDVADNFEIKSMTISSPQPYLAADYATNSAYAGGWSAGQNGGYGFGAWSFFGTDPAPGDQQEMTSSSSLGLSWTLFNLSSSSGIANAGRAIRAPGGLQVGQTFETIIDNPSATEFYKGWTISLQNNTNNNPGGVSTGELLSAYHFEYFNYGQWTVSDLSGNTGTTLYNTNTAVAGMKLDVTLTAPTNYLLTMTPLGVSGSPYTQSGSLKTNMPINWIEFNLYNVASSGTNDVADNFEIRSMTIAGTTLNVQRADANVVLSWTTNTPGFVLASSPGLGSAAVWSTNLPPPVVINDQNFVTNPISGPRRFYRLQLEQ